MLVRQAQMPQNPILYTVFLFHHNVSLSLACPALKNPQAVKK